MGSNLQLDYTPLIDAMSTFENVNPSYNNPTGIQYGDFAASFGATPAPSGSGLAVFPDLASGTQAANSLLNKYANQGYSLGQLINTWSPADAPGNSSQSTANYLDHVSGITGLSPDAPISAIGSATASAGSGGLFHSLTNSLFPISITQGVTILLGLVCVAGGIFLFKPVRETVVTATKTAVKTAAAAA